MRATILVPGILAAKTKSTPQLLKVHIKKRVAQYFLTVKPERKLSVVPHGGSFLRDLLNNSNIRVFCFITFCTNLYYFQNMLIERNFEKPCPRETHICTEEACIKALLQHQ